MTPIDWLDRHRAYRVPRLRRLLARAGFAELGVDAPAGEVFTVGSHRHAGTPPPLDTAARLFGAYRS